MVLRMTDALRELADGGRPQEQFVDGESEHIVVVHDLGGEARSFHRAVLPRWRWMVDEPTPKVSAILRTLSPWARRRRSSSLSRRAWGLPILDPRRLACSMPAFVRSTKRARSCSAMRSTAPGRSLMT